MLALVCLASLGAGPAREQQPKPYRFTIAGVPVAEGELWLALPFYTERGGPLGRRLTSELGVHLPESMQHTVQRIWDREPPRTFHLHVQRPDGTPAASAELLINEQASTCGVTWFPAGTADASGDIVASFAPEHTSEVSITEDIHELNGRLVLSESQLEELFRTGALTVVWRERRQRR